MILYVDIRAARSGWFEFLNEDRESEFDLFGVPQDRSNNGNIQN